MPEFYMTYARKNNKMPEFCPKKILFARIWGGGQLSPSPRLLYAYAFDHKLWSVHFCPIMHRWCKFGENMSNTLQDIVFRDAHTDAWTDAGTGEQDKTIMPPATLRWAEV